MIFGNQLVSYTRQMDLVRIGDQAKFENASLRTKDFRICKFIEYEFCLVPYTYQIHLTRIGHHLITWFSILPVSRTEKEMLAC